MTRREDKELIRWAVFGVVLVAIAAYQGLKWLGVVP